MPNTKLTDILHQLNEENRYADPAYRLSVAMRTLIETFVNHPEKEDRIIKLIKDAAAKERNSRPKNSPKKF